MGPIVNNAVSGRGLGLQGIGLTLGEAAERAAMSTGPPPGKTPGHRGSSALPGLAILHAGCHTLFQGELSTVPMTPTGEDN